MTVGPDGKILGFCFFPGNPDLHIKSFARVRKHLLILCLILWFIVIVNQTFTITCDTQANPPATYEIFRDDGNNVGSNSVLTTFVSEVEENNRVTFTCKASNAYGDGPTAKITVEVYCKCNSFESVC